MTKKPIALICFTSFFSISCVEEANIPTLKSLCIEKIQSNPLLHYNAQLASMPTDLIEILCKEDKKHQKLSKKLKKLAIGQYSKLPYQPFKECNISYCYTDLSTPLSIISDMTTLQPSLINSEKWKNVIEQHNPITNDHEQLFQCIFEEQIFGNDAQQKWLNTIKNLYSSQNISYPTIQYCILQALKNPYKQEFFKVIQPLPSSIIRNIIFTASRSCALNNDNINLLINALPHHEKSKLSDFLDQLLLWATIKKNHMPYDRVTTLQALINHGASVDKALYALCSYTATHKAFHFHDLSCDTLLQQSLHKISKEKAHQLLNLFINKISQYSLKPNPYLMSMTRVYNYCNQENSDFLQQFLQCYLFYKCNLNNTVIKQKYGQFFNARPDLIQNSKIQLHNFFFKSCNQPKTINFALNTSNSAIPLALMFLQEGIHPNTSFHGLTIVEYVARHIDESSQSNIFNILVLSCINSGIDLDKIHNSYTILAHALSPENSIKKTIKQLECLTLLHNRLKKYNYMQIDKKTKNFIESFFDSINDIIANNGNDSQNIALIQTALDCGQTLNIDKNTLKKLQGNLPKKNYSCHFM